MGGSVEEVVYHQLAMGCLPAEAMGGFEWIWGLGRRWRRRMRLRTEGAKE
jgi:hypothetical protein